jgi:hypothetical protein
LTDSAGRRLTKRDGAPTIRSMRQQGMSPREVIAMAEGAALTHQALRAWSPLSRSAGEEL